MGHHMMGRATRESLRWAREGLRLLQMRVGVEAGCQIIVGGVSAVEVGAMAQLVETHLRIIIRATPVGFKWPREEARVAAKISPMISCCGAVEEEEGLVMAV